MHVNRSSLLGLAVAATLATTTALAGDPAARSAGTVVDDATITAQVKTGLAGNEVTKARQINVETSKGVVQLNGFVDSATARNEAERVARKVDGVAEVRNNLAIGNPDRSGGEVLDDSGITAKVDAKLAADKRTSALGIDVATRSGVVQLSGFVKSSEEKRVAEQLAASVSGVKSVRNELDVR